MPKLKTLLALSFFVVLCGCGKTPPPRVAVKLYDSQKHLLFSSLGIKQIVFHEQSKKAEIELWISNWPTVQNLDLNNKVIDVYINGYFIQQASIATPLKANAIPLNNVNENSMLHISYLTGISTTTED